MIQKIVEVMVDTWGDFEDKAKELVAEGWSHITPNDHPLKLQIGYLFSNPNILDGNLYWVGIDIRDLKDTRPDALIPLFQSEKGKIKIAEMWGTYKEPVENPNAIKLSFEQTQELIKQYEEQQKEQ